MDHYAKLSRAMRASWVDRFLNNEIYCYPLSKKWCGPPIAIPSDHLAGEDRNLRPVWDDIFTPTISSPRGENIVTIFSPPLRYFHPLTINNGKSFRSQISLNFIMCIYNKEPFLHFLWLFTDFC